MTFSWTVRRLGQVGGAAADVAKHPIPTFQWTSDAGIARWSVQIAAGRQRRLLAGSGADECRLSGITNQIS